MTAPGTGAQEPSPSDPAAEEKKKEASAPVFHLRDASKITGHPRLEVLDVETHYGPLKIPMDQIVRVRFARRLAPELRERIQKHIEELGDEDFDKREAAMEALRQVGIGAVEPLRKAAKSSNEETKNRAEILLGELDQKAAETRAGGEDGLPALSGADDEIMTVRMTVRGTIPVSEFLIASRYGDLKVATADLSGILFRSTGPTVNKLDVAANVQPPGNWLDSRLELEKGQKLKIDATGQITVRNYSIVSGPDGNRDWGGTSFNNFPMLALVGKVGKKGQPFLIGSSYNGKAKAAGRLYLAVVSFSPYPSGASGSYKATVHIAGD
jgi:hypothetical protein